MQAVKWWQQPDGLARWVRDLLAAEMAALRPGGWPWPRPEGTLDLHLMQDLGADSLEMMSLSAALCEALDLRRADRLQRLVQAPTWQKWTEVARAQWADDDAVLRFATSGSSGPPRRQTHTLNDLLQEMQEMARVLGGLAVDGCLKRILTPVRSHHIYGFLFTQLLPSVLQARGMGQAAVVDLCDWPAAGARSVVQAGDVVVGFPDWWAAALRDGQPWPAGVIALSSTAPCPHALALQAHAQGLSAFIEIYGSSETAGIGWRRHPDEAFGLHPFWRATEGLLERQDSTGSWREPITPPDHLQWAGPRAFRPTGRRDGVVQVGGVNVSPQRVEAQWAAHPDVAAVAVRPCQVGNRQGGSGQRLKAYVVPRDATADTAALHQTLMAWARRHLNPASRPVHLELGPALPRNAMGKLCDWPIPQHEPATRD